MRKQFGDWFRAGEPLAKATRLTADECTEVMSYVGHLLTETQLKEYRHNVASAAFNAELDSLTEDIERLERSNPVLGRVWTHTMKTCYKNCWRALGLHPNDKTRSRRTSLWQEVVPVTD